jgi:hypothetical protein
LTPRFRPQGHGTTDYRTTGDRSLQKGAKGTKRADDVPLKVESLGLTAENARNAEIRTEKYAEYAKAEPEKDEAKFDRGKEQDYRCWCRSGGLTDD